MEAARQPRKQINTDADHVITFLDHAGRPSLLVHHSPTPLPPLYGFALYLTHPTASPAAVEPARLLARLIGGTALTRQCPGWPVHLALYFLPGADDAACVAHYGAERASRGDYGAQLAAVDDAAAAVELDGGATDAAGGGPGLPGVVPSYENGSVMDSYHGVLFVVPGPSSGPGGIGDDAAPVRVVMFDPVSPERWAELRDESEPEVLPEVRVNETLLADEELGLMQTVRSLIGAIAFPELETNWAWQMARKRGWVMWPSAASS